MPYLYPLLTDVSNSSPPCKRKYCKLFRQIILNNFSPPKTQWPIDNLSMFYKSAYHHAPHITTTNRYRTYIHFSRASQTPRRRVRPNRKLFLRNNFYPPSKRSDPSITYLCFTNLHTTTHNISQQLIDTVPISTSHGRLKLLAAV